MLIPYFVNIVLNSIKCTFGLSSNFSFSLLYFYCYYFIIKCTNKQNSIMMQNFGGMYFISYLSLHQVLTCDDNYR
jgi:hypothetical protein